MAEAVVEFDYQAQEPDELTIKKGETITNIKQMDGGWWEGKLNGRTGVFPDNFVKLINQSGEKQPTVTLRKGGQRKCRVLFSYKPVNEDELELHENDLIDVLGEVEEGWWRGKLKNKVGVFPSNFVKEEFAADSAGSEDKPSEPQVTAKKENLAKVIKEDVKVDKLKDTGSNVKKDDSVEGIANGVNHEAEGPTLPPKPTREYCRVRFSYSAVNEDELSLHVGEVVNLLSRQTQEKGWWRGEINGKLGVFPDNFVEIISAEEAAKKPNLNHTTKVQVNTSPQVPNSKIDAASAKPLEEIQPKVEERPPAPGKKPTAPPPSKKPAPMPQQPPPPIHPPPSSKPLPQLKIHDVLDGATQNHQAATPAQAFPKQATQTNQPNSTAPSDSTSPQSSDFDIVDRDAMLTHITVSRVKAPRRRPPSTIYKDQQDGGGMMNGSSGNGCVEDDNEEEETERVRLPTTTFERISPSKAPWVQELRMNQLKARKSQPEPPAADKKPSPPLVLPAKPSEDPPLSAKSVPRKPSRKSQAPTLPVDIAAELAVRLRATSTPVQAPPTHNRSSQQGEVTPPSSNPRRISPAIEIPATPIGGNKTSNGVRPSPEIRPVAGQRPLSSCGDKEDGTPEKDPITKSLLLKVAVLEAEMIQIQLSTTQALDRMESAIKEERDKRLMLEAQIEKLKKLSKF